MEDKDKKNNNKKKRKIIYGDYETNRETPLYVKHDNFIEGLTDEEVSVRMDNLQVNREGRLESNFSKSLKWFYKLFLKIHLHSLMYYIF